MKGERLTNSEKRIAINRVAVPVEAPGRILVVPAGDVESTSGNFIMDRAGFDLMVEILREHGTDLPIDLEHATMGGEFAAPDGSAPAMGWIKSIEWVEGQGVFASVEWTKRGAEFVREKEYRYLSPVVWVRKEDARATALHSVALTNKPAIVGMRPIVNAEKGTSAVDVEKWNSVRWFLNLPTTATESDIMTELEKLLAQLREMAGAAATADQGAVIAALKQRIAAPPAKAKLSPAVCKALGVAEDATDDAILQACKGLTEKAAPPASPDPAKFVPMADFTALKDRLDRAEGGLTSIHAEKFIARGLDEGRISANTRDAWEKRYKAHPADAEEALKLVPEGTFPKSGQVTARHSATSAVPAAGGDDRKSIIANAAREYDQADGLIVCSRAQFVNEALREKKLAAMSEDEAKSLAA